MLGTSAPVVGCSTRRARTATVHAGQRTIIHPATHPKNIFIFGLGYTSIAFGNWLAKDGWTVSGTCRTPARINGLREKGWAVDVFDPARGSGLTEELKWRLDESPYVLSSVPPLALALYDPSLSAQKALLRPLAAARHVAWFGYLSSTGVYGDWQGEWVDESSPCRQTSSKAIIRQEAESAWLQMYEQYGLPVHVFRLGGIYGPGRSVLDALASKPADLSSSQQRRGRQRFTARCHVYDICSVLSASMSSPRPGTVYNVVDDDPAPRTDVMSYARSLVTPTGPLAMHLPGSPGLDPPGRVSGGNSDGGEGAAETETAVAQDSSSSSSSSRSGVRTSTVGGFEPPIDAAGECTPDAATATATATSTTSGERGEESGDAVQGDAGAGTAVPRSRDRAAGRAAGAEPLEEKRVRNDRIRGQLGVQLRYPTYREGVAAIHAGDWWPLSPEDLRLLQL